MIIKDQTKNNLDQLRQFKVTDRITTRNGRASQIYTQDVSKTRVMTPEEESEVGKLAAAGDEKAQKKLVEANLRFVLSVAKMYSKDPIIVEDLIQAGNIGLVDAAKKFDPSMGFKFISFAVWHIRKEMIAFLSQNSRTVRIPDNKIQLMSKAREAQSQLLGELGREPDEQEILEKMRSFDHQGSQKIDIDTLKVVLSVDIRTSSLDHQFGDDEAGGSLLDILWDEEDIFEKDYDQEHYLYYVNKAMSGLSERERQVVTQYLCLDGSPFRRSFADMASDWGIGAEAVRNIYNRALKKLKQRINRMKHGRDGLFS
jgi:RNA polymerase primary sigma factor